MNQLMIDRSMSFKTDVERDRILEDVVKDSKRELADYIAREKARLENDIDQEKTKFRQELHDRFLQEINKLKQCLRNGDYSSACTHYITANWLNKELKERGF
jgi:hypothetical protein